MITYNQILAVFREIATAHLQVRQFGAGNPADIPEGVTYPLMWVVYDPTKINPEAASEQLSFKILFADLLTEDKSNEQEIISDQRETMKDVVAQLQLPAYYGRFEISGDVTAEPIIESVTTDSVAGWLASLTLRVDYAADHCAVPSTLEPSAEVGCPPVTIRDSAGNVLAIVEAGGYHDISDSNVRNSDSSYNVDLRAQQNLVLPNSTIYDHLGNILHVVPATRDQIIALATAKNTANTTIGTVPAEGIIIVGDSRINDIEGNQLASLAATVTYAASIITPAFTQSSINVNAGVAITFTDQTTATHNEYLWDFGDGTFSTSQNPSKTYLVGGIYSVTLTVGNSANGAAGILKKTNLITINNVFIIDLFGAADVAYSFRRLKQAYAGSVNRVYNGTSQQDIGFSSNEYDESSFNSFIGAGSGFAAKWYDQSGNTRDLIQSGTSSMPKVQLALINNKPSNVFDGLNDYLDASGVTTPNGKTIYIVSRMNAFTSGEQLLFDSVTTTQHGLNKSANAAQNFISIAFGNSITTTVPFTLNKSLITIVHDGVNSQIYRDATLVAGANIGSNAFNGLRLGALRGSASLFLNGLISEFIVFPAIHNTSTRQAVEQAINQYWNIY